MSAHDETTPAPSDLARLRRKPKRGFYDATTVNGIIDAAIIGHVAWVLDGQPMATPVNIWREGERLYWHASVGSRMARACAGQRVCVTVTHLDSLVLARSATNHSVDYRSVMAFGTANVVTDEAEADAVLRGLIESLYPGRWAQLRPMTAVERRATSILWITLDEASAKIRAAGVIDDEGDETWPAWGGVIPVRLARGEPEPDAHVPAGMSLPEVRLP